MAILKIKDEHGNIIDIPALRDKSVVFTPHVSADGILSWTNNGGLSNPEPVNIVGNVESIGEIVQTTGESETAVMSQKAVTDEFRQLSAEIAQEEVLDWENGGINPTDGTINYDTTRIRTAEIDTENNIYAIKAKPGYRFTVYAYEDGAYLGSLRGGEFVNSTGAEWFTEFNMFAYPLTYRYRFVGANTDGSAVTPDNARSEFVFCRANFMIEKKQRKASASTVSNIEALTRGEVCKIPIERETLTNVFAVDENGGIYAKEDVVSTTDYIKCPKYLLIDIEDEASRLILYFYDRVDDTYAPRWDLLKIVNSNNELNRLTLSTARNRIIEIPDGVYMKVGMAVDGDTSLYGWSGVHVGCEMASTMNTPDANANGGFTDTVMDSKWTGITIPGDARLLWFRDSVLVHLWGLAEDGSEVRINDVDCLQVVALPEGYKYFRATISVGYTAPFDNGEGFWNLLNHATYGVDFNEYVSCACDYTVKRTFGRARDVVKYAREIAEIEWECKADKPINTSDDHVFSKGTKYKGIPYASDWLKPCYFGWHITKHTFLNAANDEDSVFYKGSGRTGRGTGYSTVCSTYAALCAGFPEPTPTYGCLVDPHIIRHRANMPQLGELILPEVGGHVVITDTHGEGKNFSQYTLYESVSPVTLRRSEFDFIDNESHNTYAWSYINDYIYSVHHDKEIGRPNAYDISKGVLTNGSARPYRGDRGVYCSDDAILINIKDGAATRCYVQRCSYNAITDTFSDVSGSVFSVDFAAGTKQIEIDKLMLKSGFYAVYTDTSTIKEYFEYRIVPNATYSMSGNNFSFDVSTVENLLSGINLANYTMSGLTWTWNNGTCHVSGTSAGTSNFEVLVSTGSMPGEFIPGETYTAKMNANKVIMRVYYYTKNSADMQKLKDIRTQDSFTIPADAIGLRIRLSVTSDYTGTQIDETITPVITHIVKPWYALWWETDVPSKNVELIPYKSTGDYSEYRQVYNPAGASGVMFYKGVLGAYKSALTYK